MHVYTTTLSILHVKQLIQLNYTPFTSEWLPGVNVFLHFAHFRQPLCQSLPSEDTFSAANQGACSNLHSALEKTENDSPKYTGFPQVGQFGISPALINSNRDSRSGAYSNYTMTQSNQIKS